MQKLNQVNAIVTARKNETEKEVTEVYKLVQKPQLFDGRERTYRPLDSENGQKLPSESQKVVHRVDILLKQALVKWQEVWSLILTQDTGNQTASADVVVDSTAVIKAVPITSLLYLDKQINDLETFVSKMPTPDPAQEWEHDANSGLLRSKASESVRTTKESQVLVKYPATKEHPAQTEMVTKDVVAGTWTQILYSGCMPADRRDQLLIRIRKLQDAVKVAKEQANMIEVERKSVLPILQYVFGANALD